MLALSPRQQEVLQLVAAGLASAAIADRLRLSVLTVESHIAEAMCRLGARSRRHAVVLSAIMPPDTPAAALPRLDETERRLLEALAEGLTLAAAAHRAGLNSQRTASRRLVSARSKLAVGSTTAAIALWASYGRTAASSSSAVAVETKPRFPITTTGGTASNATPAR